MDNNKFEKLMKQDFMNLPIKTGWDGSDIKAALVNLYSQYLEGIDGLVEDHEKTLITQICETIIKTVDEYYQGYPSAAFDEFSKAMQLIKPKLRTYQKSTSDPYYKMAERLFLYRVRKNDREKNYGKKDIFHVPINERHKVSSCRYSIAGYSSLYLSTSLDLCCEETVGYENSVEAIGSIFRILRKERRNGGRDIKVIELSIRPQDFYEEALLPYYIGRNARAFDEIELSDPEVRKNYLYCFPLIAASSFVRVNKNNKFNSEYIIPQILMQWIHKQANRNQLIGIRYFSCASPEAAQKGFNYVFPVSNVYNKEHYCDVLWKAFKWSEPIVFKNDEVGIDTAWRNLEQNMIEDLT